MSRGRSHRRATPAVMSAKNGVRDPLASTPMRINEVGAHHTADRDFARANPSGKIIAKRTPSAIG